MLIFPLLFRLDFQFLLVNNSMEIGCEIASVKREKKAGKNSVYLRAHVVYLISF